MCRHVFQCINMAPNLPCFSAQGFVDDYLLMVRACAERDQDSIISQSVKLGFLTGEFGSGQVDVRVRVKVRGGWVTRLPGEGG